VRNFSGRLMVLTDESSGGRFGHAELARLAALGGADWVQYREKRPMATRDLVRTACRMRDAASEGGGAAIIVNDRADVALAAGAGAVHLGRNDLDPRVARRVLGEAAVIGATANNRDEALSAAGGPITYLGVGPVFETRSKANPAPVLGVDGFAAIARSVDLPVFAIGGVTADRVPELLDAGAFGVAVLSAITASRDPAEATRAFRERLRS